MLHEILESVKAAGAITLEIHDREYAIEGKQDGSPVTEADRAANECLCALLHDAFSLPVLSEETPVDYEVRRGWDRFFLVDPLDGTKDFIAKNGDYTVNVALIEKAKNGEARPVLGVVYAPASGELFFAAEGQGAWKQTIGKGPDSPKERLPLIESGELRMVKSRFHDSEQTLRFAEVNEIPPERVLQAGSSVKFGRVAEGAAGVYPRYAGSCEWDIAAGHVIVTEAGGALIDLVTGAPPAYNKEDLHNHFFIVHSRTWNFGDFKLPQ